MTKKKHIAKMIFNDDEAKDNFVLFKDELFTLVIKKKCFISKNNFVICKY